MRWLVSWSMKLHPVWKAEEMWWVLVTAPLCGQESSVVGNNRTWGPSGVLGILCQKLNDIYQLITALPQTRYTLIDQMKTLGSMKKLVASSPPYFKTACWDAKPLQVVLMPSRNASSICLPILASTSLHFWSIWVPALKSYLSKFCCLPSRGTRAAGVCGGGQGGVKSVPWEKERRRGADMILYMTL